MTSARPPLLPVAALHEGLLAAADRDAALWFVETGPVEGTGPSPFATRFPTRHAVVPAREADVVGTVAERSAGGAPGFVASSGPFLTEAAYPALVRTVVVPRRNVKLVALPPEGDGPTPPLSVRDDLGAMRSLPSMTVVAPADGPTVRTATLALAERLGPAYFRLPPRESPPVTDGEFAVGRARELRAGSDLAIIVWGAMVARGLAVADDLARVGLAARVLDVASIKPFDEAAVLRAARDTGAVLVAEAAPLGTGVGTWVAAMTSENYPVPVRRVGLPDVWPTGGAPGSLDERGLSVERLRDEAWELLRLRGKAT